IRPTCRFIHLNSLTPTVPRRARIGDGHLRRDGHQRICRSRTAPPTRERAAAPYPSTALISSPNSGVFHVANEALGLRRGRIISSRVTAAIHANLLLPLPPFHSAPRA